MSGLWLRSKNSCKSRLWHVPKTIPRVAYTGLGKQSQKCPVATGAGRREGVLAQLCQGSPCQCLLLELLMQHTWRDMHCCKAHLEGSSEEKQSLRLCSLPKRLYKEEKCRASSLTSPPCCRPQTQGVATSYSGSQGDVSWCLGKEEGLSQTGGLFLQRHLTAETYCSNVWESKLS